ncbi:hypothetical protein L0Z72_01600 [candidate division KSB1 bacterium]|nr:hypothetical protein [candidate division KSB1 bacterium]
MSIFGVVLFILGVICVIMGVGLIFYRSIKQSQAKKDVAASVDQGILKTILDFLLEVLKLAAGLFGEDQASKAGFVIVLIGIGLILIPFILPGF